MGYVFYEYGSKLINSEQFQHLTGPYREFCQINTYFFIFIF